MKRNYFVPEIKISAFSMEDVVTVSGNAIPGTSEGAQEGYAAAPAANTFQAAYSTLDFS